MELISLDDAAKVLLSDGHSSTIMRTKVRRLYDIANVLISMNLIEKTHNTERRKPAFRWIGLEGKLGNDSSTCHNKYNKRSFGTEITNIDFKRSKVESSSAKKSNFGMKKQEPVQVKFESLEYESDRSMGHNAKVRTYEFGPFAPVNVSGVRTAESMPKQVHDWENLTTTYRPQYQNPGLKELFAHITRMLGKRGIQKLGTASFHVMLTVNLPSVPLCLKVKSFFSGAYLYASR